MKKIHRVLALLLAALMALGLMTTAFAATDSAPIIDPGKKASLSIYKYDITTAGKDGAWDAESYVSTGLHDGAVTDKLSKYAIQGVEFTYLRIADITMNNELVDGQRQVGVLYGFDSSDRSTTVLSAIGLTGADAHKTEGGVNYYTSDALSNKLSTALTANATTVKNALETAVKNGGVAMSETDVTGHTSASDMEQGLYLVVETRVPENVTSTCNPFFVSLPMTTIDGAAWNYDVSVYPKNQTGNPNLEKTVRENKNSTGKHNGSLTDIKDSYAHTATASAGDVVDYQIISTLPTITSKASSLSEYTYADTMSKGIKYNKNDVAIEFFKDSGCTDKITTWAEDSGKFTVAYDDAQNIMYDPDDPDNPDKCVIERKYINEAAFSGFSLFYTASQTRNTSTEDLVVPPRSDTDVKLDYKQLLKQKTDGMVERVIANYEYLLTEAREITAREIAGYSSQILALQNANAELTKAEKEKLQEIMTVMVGASGDYYLGRTSSTYSAGAVRAMQYLGMDPANVNGLDYLAVLANTGKLEATSTYDFNSYLRDIESVSAQVWRSRGIDVGTLVDSYAVRILADQTPDGGFDYSYGVNIAQGDTNTSWRDDTIYTAKTITVLAPYRDKEYIAKAIDRAVDYLSSVQLSDGSFPGMTGDSDGGATLTVLKMMEALDISLDDPRFVKNGNTVADAMKTFYIDGVGFLSSFEVEAPLDDLSRLPVYENPVMGNYSTISALTYLQAAENGTFGPDGKGSSVFEVVGAALTETPLGAILLAVIVAGILAFAMVRRYRRIKREQ